MCVCVWHVDFYFVFPPLVKALPKGTCVYFDWLSPPQNRKGGERARNPCDYGAYQFAGRWRLAAQFFLRCCKALPGPLATPHQASKRKVARLVR